MNQMFFGNARIILFNPGSSPAPGPTPRAATRVWYGNDPNVYTDFDIEGELYGGDKEPTSLITNVTSAKKIEIGTDVTSIGFCAFSECNSLTSVTIPDSVRSIGSDAFAYSGITGALTISNNVTTIDFEAFYLCRGLTSVTIPDSVESIGYDAFSVCSGLTSVTIVATGKPGASAANVRSMMEAAGANNVSNWIM